MSPIETLGLRWEGRIQCAMHDPVCTAYSIRTYSIRTEIRERYRAVSSLIDRQILGRDLERT